MQSSVKGRLGDSYAPISEVAILVGMAATLLVPSLFDNILPWTEIPVLLYVRAAFWITGLAFLPGVYVFRIFRLLDSQSEIIKITLSSLLSFGMVGTAAMIYYEALGNLSLFPAAMVALLALLAVVSWRRRGLPALALPQRLTRSQALLLAAIAATVAVATIIQLSWRYLIYTDFWTSLYPAVKMVFGRDVFSAYVETEYPVAYGYIIGGFSSGAGMPIVNTQALMLPLIALNPLVFFTLVKVVFSLSDRVAALGSVIYVLGGGLGWVFNTFITHGVIAFIPLSGFLRDMYFFPPFWDQIAFQFKLLALILALSSIVLFSLGVRVGPKDGKRSILLVVLSAFLFVWAFTIHMLPGFLAPVFVAVALFNSQKRFAFKPFLALVVSGFALLFAHDLVMGGVYVSLIRDKALPIVTGLGTTRLIILGAGAVGAAAVSFVGYYAYLYWRHHHKAAPEAAAEEPDGGSLEGQPRTRGYYAKALVVLGLAAAYLAGLLFVNMATFTLVPEATFPWYTNVTRYGFMGILAFVGLATSKWRAAWFKIAAFWAVMAIFLGSVWWGERLNAFLFPIVALMASIGVINVLKRALQSFPRLRSGLDPKGIKWLGASVAVIVLLVLSFGSLVAGVYWHVTLVEQTSNDMASSLNWIGNNIPQNDTVMLDSDIHPILFGVLHLTDHNIQSSTEDWGDVGYDIFDQISFLKENNIRWVVVNDSLPALTGAVELVRGLQNYGDLAHESGPFSVRSIPKLHAPSASASVAVVDRAFLGISQLDNRFIWYDDSLSSWTVVNGSSDGQILTLSWNYTSADKSGPSAYIGVPQFSASAYPFLIFRYRNTPGTTTSPEANATQYVRVQVTAGNASTLSAQMPISEEYQVVYLRLPSNYYVNRTAFLIQNNGGANGTIGLEIDYVGFSSTLPIYDPSDPHFLSIAVPATWPEGYAVYDDFHTGGESTVITTFRNGIEQEIAQLQNGTTVVLFNNALYQPTWGDGWSPMASGVISGTYSGKRVIIVSAGAQQIEGSLSQFSSWLYGEIS